MKYENCSEEELYQILKEYGTNVDRIRKMGLSLQGLRDFVRCLDRLLCGRRLDAFNKNG
jgi:hypothetical protein